ncbi:mitochondrial import inner membrane translocase subunit TIM17-1-like [Arachis ipaensis]|uniref:mitochondrial import inner membrane translocase subunit TIM17-1-like n=1 Tax=Arachis ipaensis TaxID=130454 RepID=UPI0007AEEFC0|nr:mitochondrial import inner membrane translocase subunit TIM17-1-like [Arachis ipaensis]XP_025682257.1 mitochondrial import inner membrane translocase subunit TIM17-1-like [Arachis hypogaea]
MASMFRELHETDDLGLNMRAPVNLDQFGFNHLSTFYFFKSLRISPTHIPTACHAVRLNAPRVGGKFAAWNALCYASHYALVSVRQKDDGWNSIFSTAIGTGLLSVCRRSLRASARFTMGGALLGAVAQVSSIMLDMHV